MYVVTVLFTLAAESRQRFEPMILDNAARSLEETGCLRFDVCFSADGRGCFLYEIYTDRAAFDDHLKTAHFRSFNESSGALVIEKRIETYLLSSSPTQA